MRVAQHTLALLIACSFAHSAAAQTSPRNDCSSPRAAAETFLANLQDGQEDLTLATKCFSWRAARVRGTQARETLARKLKAVLDQRGLYVDIEALPAATDAEDGRVEFTSRLPVVYLEEVDGQWLISEETIQSIEALHQETFTVDVERYIEKLPSWARTPILPGMALWQLLGVLAALLLGFLARLLATSLVVRQGARVLKAAGQTANAEILQRSANPIGTLVMVAVLWWMLPLLRFSARVNQIGTIALRVMAATAVVLLVYRLVDLGADIFAQRAERTETKLDDQIVPLIRKTLKVFVLAVGVIFVLQNLDVDVGSLLAGVSLGGLAFTLAAKDTVANLFGSVSIFADQPFQVGDWVVIDGHEGVVAEVGMRSTRIRTFYDSLISIPNSTVANAAVDNYGQRRYRRCMVTLGLTYGTTPDQMQAFVEGIRAILRANVHVRKDAYEVHFRNFGASSLEVMLYFFFQVASWTDELRERQNVFLEVMRLAGALGVEFAFPTQTLHLASRVRSNDPPPRDVPGDLGATVRAFGPGGDRSTASTPEVAGGFWPAHDAPAGDGAGGQG